MYALNVKKGTTVQHPEISLKGGWAAPVSDRLANQLKHVINVVVFEGVVGQSETEHVKGLYGVNMDTLNRSTEFRTYRDFVSEFKDVKVAAEKWESYKKEMGLKE